jgi:hypothetical protein
MHSRGMVLLGSNLLPQRYWLTDFSPLHRHHKEVMNQRLVLREEQEVISSIRLANCSG